MSNLGPKTLSMPSSPREALSSREAAAAPRDRAGNPAESTSPSSPLQTLPYRLFLELSITDPDVIQTLLEHEEGDDRHQFATEALKVGVLALRHASGHISAETIQRESQRLIAGMERAMQHHTQTAHERMTSALREYFDPQNGRFSERVERLVRGGGELENVLKRQLDGDESQLVRTLAAHVGSDSPLMKVLSPQQSDGLLAELRTTVEKQLSRQQEQVLREFSLNSEDSALSLLVRQLKQNHGNIAEDLQKKIDEVRKEFSLDEEGSALKRLVDNVELAQQKICEEFSLDSEKSALKRFKTEVMTVFQAHMESSAKFQEEVKLALQELVTRRQEQDRSTQHGKTFEEAVHAFLQHESLARGDGCEFTGHTPGAIKHCKVGDVVVQLGPDTPAPGVAIVFEAKEEGRFTLTRARDEIEQARKNRVAEAGVFVFSHKTAPAGQRPLVRFGRDLLVIWDAEDPATDPFLLASLEIARFLCFEARRQTESQEADFAGIDEAILDIEKRAANLDTVRTSAETIRSASEKILDRVRIDRAALDKQVTTLREKLDDLRAGSSP